MYDNFWYDFEAFSNSWWPYVIAMIVSIISAIRVYAAGVQYQKNQRMDDKTVIITGGATGIGFETAKNLTSRGAYVILAVRDADKGKTALQTIKYSNTNAKVVIKILDIADINNIKKFVQEIEKEFDKIDVLINNAAVIYEPFMLTADGMERTMSTNYFGPFLLTHLLLPLLHKSENGRIINLSAMAHYQGTLKLEDLDDYINFDEKNAYSRSKLALTIFTKYLANLLTTTNITCNAVSPGLVRGTNHLQKLPLQKSVWTRLSVLPWMWLFLKTPKQGCQSVVYLAAEPSLRNMSGHYFSDCEIKEPNKLVKDIHLAELIYRKSCKMVGIDGKNLISGLSHMVDESEDKDESF